MLGDLCRQTSMLHLVPGTVLPVARFSRAPVVRYIAANAFAGGAIEERAMYVDGFLLAVPKKNLKAYRSLARRFATVAKDSGALSVVESVADDVTPGKLTSFPQSVKLKKGEVVVFSWITFKSRAHRDRVNSKIMKDPRMGTMMQGGKAVFDGKRMIHGGFKAIVQA
jgi:uncharacterized protein YbaA (DUF1428 family)